MRIILLGLPGSGKGTQARLLSKKLRVVHVSIGDVLRAAVASGSVLGAKAEQHIANGGLVPDAVVIELAKERITQPDCVDGFILDGFPRTQFQAEAIRAGDVDIDFVIEISVPEKQILDRISGRRVHVKSGRVYHVIYSPPKLSDRDDVTGETLIQRPDDREEIVIKRIENYHRLTEPLVDYYLRWANTGDSRAPKFIKVSGIGSVEAVHKRLLNSLQDFQRSTNAVQR